MCESENESNLIEEQGCFCYVGNPVIVVIVVVMHACVLWRHSTNSIEYYVDSIGCFVLVCVEESVQGKECGKEE